MTPAGLSVLVRWPQKAVGSPTVCRGTDVVLHPELSLLPTPQGQRQVTDFLGPSQGMKEGVAGRGSHCPSLPS